MKAANAGELFAVPPAQLHAFVRGAVSIAKTATGIAPLRAPEIAFTQLPEPFAREVFRMTSGVRLALSTDATVFELDVAASRMHWDTDPPNDEPAVFDLVVDGRLHTSASVGSFAQRVFVEASGEFIREGEMIPATLRFDGLDRLDGRRTELELWFPPNAAVELQGLRANAPVQPSSSRPRWIHYGSSISHCAEARRPTETWPALVARRRALDLLNLGVAGNCHLDPFVARAIRDQRAACISLELGINIAGSDTLKHRTLVPAVHGYIDTIREGHPGVPILLVSPIICPELEHEPAAPQGLCLAEVREILAEIVDARALTDAAIHYLDGLRLLGEADLADLPDGLHPSPAGYLRIAERFDEAVLQHGCFAPIAHSAAIADPERLGAGSEHRAASGS